MSSQPMNPLSVIIVEDHEFMRTGLAFAVRKKSPFDLVGEAGDGIEALALVEEKQPNLVVMDIGMPRMDGVTAAQQIKEKYPEIKVIMLTSRQNEDEIRASITAGADAYCMKDISVEKLIQVMQLVADGGIWLDPAVASIVSQSLANSEQSSNYSASEHQSSLTDREKEVLKLIVQGKSNKEIAMALGITLPTTKVHVSNIIQKLAVDDRTQAAVKAIQNGMVQPGQI